MYCIDPPSVGSLYERADLHRAALGDRYSSREVDRLVEVAASSGLST
jgi:hypothetical protein